MKKAYYREQALERIARDVITAYDPRLYYGSPAAIPIENIIEAQGLVLEYQYLRNNGRVLGETIFDDGLTAIYDWENHRYDLLPVKGGTILIDCSLCEEEASTGRLRFTCAHELGHWLLHLEPLGVEMSPSAEDTAAEREETSETAMQLKRLTEALSELNTAERQLMQALYFEGIPAREYARQLGVYHRTVLYRRDQLLEKLRRMIFA